MANTDRDVLFANESFVIGMLQVVSGSTLVAALAQADAISKLATHRSLIWFITSMAASLLASVLSAYWKHQYKMWDVKAQASASRNEESEARTRSNRSGRYLRAMRGAFVVSLLALALGFVGLIASMWSTELWPS